MNKTPAALCRIGEGWDVHALVTGRRLILGGVEIPHTHGLLGHSDADALCHAVTDALFGASALGDLGHHFPRYMTDVSRVPIRSRCWPKPRGKCVLLAGQSATSTAP